MRSFFAEIVVAGQAGKILSLPL